MFLQTERNKYLCLLVLVIFAAMLTGCGDRSELENNAYVIAIGIDKAKKKDAVQISFLIANPEYGSQQEGASTDEPPVELISFEANDVSTARNLANTVIAKKISYSLLRTMIVSETFAKDKRFIRWMYDGSRDPDIRRDIRLVVSHEPVIDFFENNRPRLESRPHKYFEFMLKRGTETATIPNSLLNHYFRITEADADAFLAIYSTTIRSGQKENKHQEEGYFTADQFRYRGETNAAVFAGSAIFKRGRMIGKLTAEETRIAIELSNIAKASDVLTTFPDPLNEHYKVGVRLRKNESNSIQMNLEKKQPEIDVTIPLIADVVSVHSLQQYAASLEKQHILKHALEKDIETRAKKLIQKTQRVYGVEPFGWSLKARREFLTNLEYERFDWMKQYPHMKVNVKVELSIQKFGRQDKSIHFKEGRE